MNIIISHAGEVTQMPTFGCYAGCSQNYCYIFGIEISDMLYFFLTTFLFFIGIFVVSFFTTKFYLFIYNKLRRTKKEKITMCEKILHFIAGDIMEKDK